MRNKSVLLASFVFLGLFVMLSFSAADDGWTKVATLEKRQTSVIDTSTNTTLSEQYPGAYTWATTPVHSLHPDWTDTSMGGCVAWTIPEKWNHSQVVELKDESIANPAQMETVIPVLKDGATDIWLTQNGTGTVGIPLPGEYNGSETFDTVLPMADPDPTNWVVSEPPTSDVRVIQTHVAGGGWDGQASHETVLELAKQSATAAPSATFYFPDACPYSDGLVVEWWMCQPYDDTLNRDVSITIGDGVTAALWMVVGGGTPHVSVYSTLVGSPAMQVNYWTHFEWVYSPIANQVELYMNGVNIWTSPLMSASIPLTQMRFGTSNYKPSLYSGYIDAIGWSWHPGYVINQNQDWKYYSKANTTTVEFLDPSSTVAFQAELYHNNSIRASNGSTNVNVGNWSIGCWSHLRFEFDSIADTYTLYVNQTEQFNLQYAVAVGYIDKIRVKTHGSHYSAFVDTVDYSWVSPTNLSFYEFSYDTTIRRQLQFPVNATHCNLYNLSLYLENTANTTFFYSSFETYDWHNATWHQGVMVLSENSVISESFQLYPQVYIQNGTRALNLTFSCLTITPLDITLNSTYIGYFYLPYTCDICDDCPDCDICDDCDCSDCAPTNYIWALVVAIPIAATIMVLTVIQRRRRR